MAKMSNCILNRNQIKISMEWFKCTKNIFFLNYVDIFQKRQKMFNLSLKDPTAEGQVGSWPSGP